MLFLGVKHPEPPQQSNIKPDLGALETSYLEWLEIDDRGTVFSRKGLVIAVFHLMQHVPIHGLQPEEVGRRLYNSNISTCALVYNV